MSYRREKKEIPQIRQLKPRKTPVEIVEAESAFAKVIDLNPKHVTAHLGRDNMLSSRGMRTVAKACFREALEIDPENKLAIDSLFLVAPAPGEPH